MGKSDIVKIFSNRINSKENFIRNIIRKPSCTGKLEYVPPQDIVTISSPKIKFKDSGNIEDTMKKIVIGEKQVGNVSFSEGSFEAQLFNDSSQLHKIYPESWFSDGKLKQFLSIDGSSTINHQGRGYGRFTMQELYRESVARGYGGRMTLDAWEGAEGFYSKMGFDIPIAKREMFDKIYQECLKIAKEQSLSQEQFSQLLKERGVPEIINGKYNIPGTRIFDPTEENLAILFKK